MSDLAIELSGVGKSYPFFSLANINLQVPQGQIMGLIGPNGAGNSTTIRILMGLVRQDRGEVRVLGRSMPAEQVAAKWDIGFASEDMRPYESMTLASHMQFIRSIYASNNTRRRLRLEAPSGVTMPALPGIIRVGRTAGSRLRRPMGRHSGKCASRFFGKWEIKAWFRFRAVKPCGEAMRDQTGSHRRTQGAGRRPRAGA